VVRLIFRIGGSSNKIFSCKKKLVGDLALAEDSDKVLKKYQNVEYID
jgi:hypothetical protein